MSGICTIYVRHKGRIGALHTEAKTAPRHPDVGRALDALAAEGKATGARSAKISVRVDPGVFAASAATLGIPDTQVSEVVTAALALAAAPDRFKLWLLTERGTLPDDFELAI
jgi:hypothetical protein